MKNLNGIKRNITGRHPIYQGADKIKRAFLQLGFQLIDNGEGLEIEKADVTFATWAEPPELFAWQNAPLKMRQGHTNLRTRLLPAHLQNLKQRPPFRLLAFGRVYQDNKHQPLRHQIEGIAIESGLSLEVWKEVWQSFAYELFAAAADVLFEPINDEAYRISVKTPADGKTYLLGYTGPASIKALQVCGAGDIPGWVFAIDADRFALAYFSIANASLLYENDVNFLSGFTSKEPAFGDSPACAAVDALRDMGYQETCGAVLYTAETYKKMNMIQEAWDTNNQGYPLVKPLGDFTATRTVLTPAIEEIMGLNYKRGATELRVFEAGHIYLPKADQLLPKEHLAISIGTYGPEVTIESFAEEVTAFLQAMGIRDTKFVPTSMATAYKWNECLIILNKKSYIHSNFGRINEIAAKNHGIGVPAYMANFELDALVSSAHHK